MFENFVSLGILFILSIVTQITFPVPLDAILLGMAAAKFNYFLLVSIAVVGLTLGATFNYFVGRFEMDKISWLHKRKKSKGYKRADKFYKKYGKWTLLFSACPFVGKYFPLLAGIMGTKFVTFLSIYVLGKVFYYSAIALIVFFPLAKLLSLF
jgi:membrane protein YqaA with SNARE-associated domain